jgi:hypothetical protein
MPIMPGALYEDEDSNDDLSTYPHWPQSVMTELGRCGDRAAIRAMADRLKGERACRAEALAARVRQWRLGERPARPSGLAQVLVRAINRYGVQHPGLPLQTVEDALWRLLHSVQDERERREGSSEP